MATFTLSNIEDRYPNGTVVIVYKSGAIQNNAPPVGAAVTFGTVSNGTVELGNVQPNVSYTTYASVEGQHRYVGFLVPEGDVPEDPPTQPIWRNVKDLGVVGNGVTNDRAAIQAAIDDLIADGGGELFFPRGTYVIGSPGIVLGPFDQTVTLRGEGGGGQPASSQTTRLVRNGAYPIISAVGTGQAPEQLCETINLKDLCVDGAGQSGVLLLLDRVANCWMERLKVHNAAGSLVLAKQHWNCHWTDCHFNGGGSVALDQPAVHMTESTDVTGYPGTNTVHFTACEFEGNNYTDVRLSGATYVCVGVVFANCKWERNNAGNLLHFKKANACVVTGSYLYVDLSLDPILHEEGFANVIAGNTIAANGAPAVAGIYLWKGNDIAVTGNSFLQSSGFGIRMDPTFGEASIVGNQVATYGSAKAVNDLRTTKKGLVQTGGSLRAFDGLTTKVKAGVPIDGDFGQTPPDGTFAVDSTNNKIMVRIGGTWKGVTVA